MLFSHIPWIAFGGELSRVQEWRKNVFRQFMSSSGAIGHTLKIATCGFTGSDASGVIVFILTEIVSDERIYNRLKIEANNDEKFSYKLIIGSKPFVEREVQRCCDNTFYYVNSYQKDKQLCKSLSVKIRIADLCLRLDEDSQQSPALTKQSPKVRSRDTVEENAPSLIVQRTQPAEIAAAEDAGENYSSHFCT